MKVTVLMLSSFLISNLYRFSYVFWSQSIEELATVFASSLKIPLLFLAVLRALFRQVP